MSPYTPAGSQVCTGAPPSTSSPALVRWALSPQVAEEESGTRVQGKAHVGSATPNFLDTFLRGKLDSTPSCITLLRMCSMVPWKGSPILLGGAGQTPSSGILVDLPKVTQPQVKKAEGLGWLTAKKGFFPPNHNSFGMKKSFSALSEQQRHQRCF